MSRVCNNCDMELKEVEATIGYGSEETEDVFVCYNKECDKYDTVITYGDLEDEYEEE